MKKFLKALTVVMELVIFVITSFSYLFLFAGIVGANRQFHWGMGEWHGVAGFLIVALLVLRLALDLIARWGFKTKIERTTVLPQHDPFYE